MKFILFCQNPYAFGILEPIMEVLKNKQYDFLWFLTPNLSDRFPFQEEPHTSDLEELTAFESDAILCPGNEVPHYLRGVKVQIFHGLAGEKKGHFKIRHYFDLYLTQGPYFTRRFLRLKRRHRNFEVVETGWPKLDIYGRDSHRYEQEKREWLSRHNASRIVLYAPTFSPSLTGAPYLIQEVKKLASRKDYLILIKFHDLMAREIISQYRQMASQLDNVEIVEEPNIVKYLLIADMLISDTSSVVYEFLLLDKPVLTYKSNSQAILWDDQRIYENLDERVRVNLEQDPFREERQKVIDEYHPYHDGKSAERMVEAVETYIENHGVPERRKLPFLRRRKMNRMFKRKRKRFRN